MKIYSRDLINGTQFYYAQLKDIKFVAQDFDSVYIMNYYLELKARGKKDNDFIRLDNEVVCNAIVASEDVISFNEYSELSPLLLSRRITNSTYDSVDRTHRNDAIRDIMCYQRHDDLGYKIPALPNGGVAAHNMDETLMYYSTILKGVYIFKTFDGSPIKSYDYEKFYNDSLTSMLLHENLDLETANIVTCENENLIIISISEKQPVKEHKENVFKRLIKRRDKKNK